MKLGSTDINDVRLGSTPISEVRRGLVLIWPDPVLAPSYSAEYQAVLDYASANSITPPSAKYNSIIDRGVRKLVADGVWTAADVLWYFKHDGSREFATLNLLDPTQFQLIDVGTNPVTFTPEVGFWVSGGNGQVFSTQFTPSLHAVNLAVLSSGVFFKLTQTPTSSAGTGRILGGTGSTAAHGVNIIQQQGSLLPRVFESAGSSSPIDQTLVNKSYIINDFGISKQMVQDEFQIGTGGNNNTSQLTPVPLSMFGFNNNGSVVAAEGKIGLEYLGMGASMNDKINSVFEALNEQYFEKIEPGTTAFTAAQTSENSVFFGQVEKASKFPTLNTTKPFIVLYGNNHGGVQAGDGKCMWAEMDALDGTGFIERGIIASGYQANTPYLQLVPNDPDGLILHFTWHPSALHPDSGGYQQTRLWRRAGGDLHDDTGWTKDGRVLGLINPPDTEAHTGYLISMTQPDNTLVGIHSAKGGNLPKIGKSTSPDGKTWTRVTSDVDVSSFMPRNRQFHHSTFYYFTRNGKQYLAGKDSTVGFDVSKSRIGISLCANNDYLPTKYLGSISEVGAGHGNTDTWYYIDSNSPDVLHIYYVVADTDVKYTTWDLKNLD